MAAGVVFDCDGTLLDTIDMWMDAQDELARRAGVVLTDEQTKEIGSRTIPEVGVYFNERFGLGDSGEDVVSMLDAIMLGFYETRATERIGALSFVKELCELGVRCSVASASPQAYLQAGLGFAGFSPYLDAIVSVDDVGVSKRDPAVYNRACELMGTKVEETWAFEDSLFALHTLCNAGYRSVGVYDRDISGTFEELKQVADVAVRSFTELDPRAFR